MRTLLGQIVLFGLSITFWLSECNCNVLTVNNINTYVESAPHKPFVDENITEVQPEALELYKEKTLNLNFNGLRYLPSNFFHHNPSYEKALFKLNFLQNISSRCFLGLKNLTEIDLSYNQLEVIRAGLFRENHHLKIIYLNHNMKLKIIRPDVFSNLKELKYLYLQYNHLRKFDLHEIGMSKKLRRLYLNHNKLREIDYRVFNDHFHDLKLLALADNMFNCSFTNETEAFLRSAYNNTVRLSLSCIMLIDENMVRNCHGNEKPPDVELLQSHSQVLPQFFDENEMRTLISHQQQVERRTDVGSLHRNAQMLFKK